MTDKKITQLTSGITVSGDELVFVSSPGSSPATKQTTMDNVGIFGGWVADADTWVYVSATSFKIVGKDVRTRFGVGTKLKLTNNTIKFFYVVSTAYSSDTTITITGGTTYSLDNAVITSPYFSYGSPPNFPNYFSWTPTWTSLTTTGSPIYTGKFAVYGRLLKWTVAINPNGGTTASTANTTYINNPPIAIGVEGAGIFTQVATLTVGGICASWGSGQNRIYTPTWAANSNYFAGAGGYFI